MKVVRNAGDERVLDVLRPRLKKDAHLDLVTPGLSLFAFEVLLDELLGLSLHGQLHGHVIAPAHSGRLGEKQNYAGCRLRCL